MSTSTLSSTQSFFRTQTQNWGVATRLLDEEETAAFRKEIAAKKWHFVGLNHAFGHVYVRVQGTLFHYRADLGPCVFCIGSGGFLFEIHPNPKPYELFLADVPREFKRYVVEDEPPSPVRDDAESVD